MGRGTMALAAGLALAFGCPSEAFLCTQDSECGDSGQCEATGYCSFPDDECASGRRYEPHAGQGLASRCVPVMDAGTGSGTSGANTGSGGGDGSSDSPGLDEGTATDDTADASTDGGDPGEPTIVIDPSIRHQTLDGMGIQAWDYPIHGGNDWNWKAAEPAFNEVDIHYAQLITIFNRWEPSNDNDDPFVTDYDVMDPSGEIALGDIAMGQYLVQRGLEVNVQKVALPGWLTEDGEVPESMYAEFAESVASYQIHLEANGVPQSDVDLWQVGNSQGVFNSPEAAVGVARQMLDSFAALGLQRQLITPSVPGSVADEWFSTWFENPDLVAATVALSVRGVATIDMGHFEAVGGWSDELAKPVWAYDNWYCGADQGCPAAPAEDSTTWASAWEMAQQNYRLIVGARATRIYHAAMVGAQPSVDPMTGAKNPTFYVLQHFANWIAKDAVLVAAVPTEATILPTVVANPDGTYGLVLLNTAPDQTQVEIGFSDQLAVADGVALQSVAGSYMNEQTTTPTDDGFRVTLPANSITSLRASAQ